MPEGPRCVEVNGRPMLGWVNIQTAPDSTAGSLRLYDWDTGDTHSLPLPGRPGFFLPTTIPNVVLLGLTKHLGIFDLNTSDWQPLVAVPDENPRTILNDGEVTPDGRYVVFGTKDTLFKEPIAHLYLFDAEAKTVHALADGQTCSNGKIIHAGPDGYTLYDIDTPTRQVRQYHLHVSPPRLEYVSAPLDLHDAVGFPDGMADAGDGAALIAFYNPDAAPSGSAIAYDLKTGAVLAEWKVPSSPRVTCPLLSMSGGKSRVVLTTASEGMPEEMHKDAPNAGTVFIAEGHFDALPNSVLVKIIR